MASPRGPESPRPPSDTLTPESHEITASDGTALKLTRYRGGTKGPLIAAPGYGNTAHVYALDTPRNWVAHLVEHGYDVWLLDYRASPDLPARPRPFTIDDVARRDWPAAVAHVRAVTGADTVQVQGHCIGGLSLFMALGAGLEGVRSATFSALAGHPVPNTGNRLRCAVRVPNLLRALGIAHLPVGYDPASRVDRAIDAVMRILPFRHKYPSPWARRISFVYGDPFAWANLDEAALGALPGAFGGSDMTAMAHIARMCRHQEARDAHGRDTYWHNKDAYRLPMHFVTGAENRMFLPVGLRRTYDRLCRLHGGDLYRYDTVPGYAHLDLWLGAGSARDVYPTVLAELEKHN